MTEAVPDKVKDLVTSQIAMRRFGEPNEIADAIAFLGEHYNLSIKTHESIKLN
jgi:NAD(P)-dependent dehydrogenase (short-subunit alcohol dehydrogenase family)